MSQTMRAIVIPKFGGPEVLAYQEVSKPTPGADEVLIRVAAFGLNHAEMHMRKGEWDEWNPITGLECVGTVESANFDSSSSISSAKIAALKPGAKVAALMGGMGRERPGSYGEFVAVRASNVIPIETNLPWEKLAAIPEVYGTAQVVLFTILDLQPGEKILIRGATSTVGQAAVHLAVDAGAIVTATTRRTERFDWLTGPKFNAAEAVKEEKGLFGSSKDGQAIPSRRFDKILNLIGNSVLVETISLTRVGGRICQAGWLGGLAPVQDFNPMIEMPPGIHFSLYHSKVIGDDDFPVDKVFPLQEIVTKIENGKWDAEPALVFGYEEIQQAHRALDTHDTGGKIVVKH
ncbi:GroES-like protein [Xylariaceae sp. FL0255]|nr:GroES-like protein [Xylariaceae sp. FL0255]